jgi:hypothetical protein
MLPFRVRSEEKLVSVDLLETLGNENEFLTKKDHICTDWEIYLCTLYHLMQNAIKFSKSGKNVKL